MCLGPFQSDLPTSSPPAFSCFSFWRSSFISLDDQHNITNSSFQISLNSVRRLWTILHNTDLKIKNDVQLLKENSWEDQNNIIFINASAHVGFFNWICRTDVTCLCLWCFPLLSWSSPWLCVPWTRLLWNTGAACRLKQLHHLSEQT